MSALHPAWLNQIPPVVSASAWLCSGMLVGAFHFLMLRWTVQMFAVARPLLLPLGLQFIRFVLMAALLATIANFLGALPLLVATMGMLIARTIIVRLEPPS